MAEKSNPKKEPKRKPKYGMLSCVGYIYKMLWQSERWLVFTGIFTVPVTVALTALALYTPTLVLRALERSERFSTVALVIFGLLLTKLLFDLANNAIEVRVNCSEFYIFDRMSYLRDVCIRDRDWYLNYDPRIQKLDERANAALINNHSAGVHFPMDFAGIAASLLNFVLFGAVISMLSPWVILLLALGAAADYGMGAWVRRQNYAEKEIRDALRKKIIYVGYDLPGEFKFSKDIRLYSMREDLHRRFSRLIGEAEKEERKVERRKLSHALVSFLIIALRDGAAYAFLLSRAVAGGMDAASFVLYFSAITSMAALMGEILGKIGTVSEGAMQVSDLREDLENTGCLNRGPGIPAPSGPFSIEFRNVSYQYPVGERKVLDGVSFKIEPGEKIALVGVNGAGKTTLTMLMCGLLLPDEGDILINGHVLTEYNRDELYALFGVVPQDYHLLPVSIAQNIACEMEEDKIDRARLARCIELAGLTEKLKSLPRGADTLLDREVNRDAAELSGGEAQKLLLARLLYKNPPCIVLDEPTAALDPIAEDRMYRKYNEIASNTTSVFISHRLASTRFCDRIFLLDGARFAETGTHENLMALGGKYRELFDIQSKYYREGEDNGEN